MANKYSTKKASIFSTGCKPSIYDSRDFCITECKNLKYVTSPPTRRARLGVASTLYPRQNLSLYQWTTPVTNQGRLQSCVGHATVAALELLRNKQGKDRTNLSEAFTWYKARLAQGWQTQNTGTYIRDALKSLLHDGVVEEQYFPYNDEDYKTSPPWLANLAARWTRIKAFYDCENVEGVKLAIDNGMPVVIGANIGSGFRNYVGNGSGVLVQDLNANYGHAMMLLAYDDSRNAFLIKNSWSAQWALNGYLWASYDWFNAQVFEAWAVNA